MKINNIHEFIYAFNYSFAELRKTGWRLSYKDFCDPSKRRLDPIAVLWMGNYYITKEISEIFYRGFLGKENSDNQLIKFGKMLRKQCQV